MGPVIIGALVMGSIVFGASATSKLSRPAAYRTFRSGIAGTGLVPRNLLAQVTAALAAAEVTAAMCLAVSAIMMCVAAPDAMWAARAALLAAIALTAVLIAGVASVIRRGVSARCACFGAASGQPLGRTHLIRNVIFVSLLVGALVSTLYATPIAQAVSAMAAAVGAIIALLLIRWEDLAALMVSAAVPNERQKGMPSVQSSSRQAHLRREQ
jgi:hypothetical protein